jgi:uncharacterized protein YqgV (UPF0045/DUF77 family)
MNTAVEISLYPLTKNYIPLIDKFIEGLHAHPDIRVSTNDLSTHIYGNYDSVMRALNKEIKNIMRTKNRVSFVIKILNTE